MCHLLDHLAPRLCAVSFPCACFLRLCELLISPHPRTSIVAANRDEVLARPATRSAWHAFPSPSCVHAHLPSFSSSVLLPTPLSSPDPTSQTPILSGIDIDPSGGGTWVGVTVSGSFAFLTNFTESSPPPLPAHATISSYRSRGSLPKDWLLSESSAATAGVGMQQRIETYLDRAGVARDEYPGFNLLLGGFDTNPTTGERTAVVGYLTNRDPAPTTAYPLRKARVRKVLRHGGRILETDSMVSQPTHIQTTAEKEKKAQGNGSFVCGLSNSTIDDPWPKVVSGEQLFQQATLSSPSFIPESTLASRLFTLLRSTSTTGTLQDQGTFDFRASVRIPPVFVPSKIEPRKKVWYATRLSTVWLVPRSASEEAEATWIEQEVTRLDSPSGDTDQGKLTLLNEEEAQIDQKRYTWSIGTKL